MRKTRDLPPLLARADADAVQGTGHVMRSLVLARAWHERGGAVHFVSARPTAALKQRMKLAGATVTEIEEPDPAGVDLQTTRTLIKWLTREHESSPWVIVDGYHFTADYQSALRRAACRLLVIDDNAHLPRYDADIVLNHGIQASRLGYGDDGDAWFLLGTRYALLRPEFAAWRAFERTIPETARKILVTMGGADLANATATIIDSLALIGDAALEVQILAGALNPHIAELRRIAATMPNVELRSDVTDPAPLMAWADIAVAAAGTTAWELAFMQTPALLLVAAENQISVAAGADDFGAARSLGEACGLSRGDIASALRDLIHDAARRRRMAERGKILVDGQGPSRVLAAMERRGEGLQAAEWTIRYADHDDELLLWQWANDPATRRNSFNCAAISWDDHQRWCAAKLASPDCRLWIMRAGDVPVGQIRYERRGRDTAELSFSVGPGFRGNGLGTRLLQSTFDLAARELGVSRLEGAALALNEASRRAFIRAGFTAAEELIISGKPCVMFRRHCDGPVRKTDHVPCH